MSVAAILAGKGSLVATITPEATVNGLLAELSKRGIGALVVSSDGRKVLGIVSERDVVKVLHERGASALDAPVSSIMTRMLHTVSPSTSISDVMVMMTEKRVRHLPVLDKDALVGIISIGDAVKHRIDDLEHERSALVGYIQSGG